jgi:hypothetical protein
MWCPPCESAGNKKTTILTPARGRVVAAGPARRAIVRRQPCPETSHPSALAAAPGASPIVP